MRIRLGVIVRIRIWVQVRVNMVSVIDMYICYVGRPSKGTVKNTVQ